MSSAAHGYLILPKALNQPLLYWGLTLAYTVAILNSMPAVVAIFIALSMPIGKRQLNWQYRTLWIWALGLVAASGYVAMHETLKTNGLPRDMWDFALPILGVGVIIWHTCWVKLPPDGNQQEAPTVHAEAESTTP